MRNKGENWEKTTKRILKRKILGTGIEAGIWDGGTGKKQTGCPRWGVVDSKVELSYFAPKAFSPQKSPLNKPQKRGGKGVGLQLESGEGAGGDGWAEDDGRKIVLGGAGDREKGSFSLKMGIGKRVQWSRGKEK